MTKRISRKADKSLCMRLGNKTVVEVRRDKECADDCITYDEKGNSITCEHFRIRPTQYIKDKKEEVEEMKKCPYCAIVKKESPGDIIHESVNFITFVSSEKSPVIPYHFEVVPKRHMTQVSLMSDKALVAELFNNVLMVSMRLEIPEFRLVMNIGKTAGQMTEHAHINFGAGKTMSDKFFE